MVALQIRDVSDSDRDALAGLAALRGQSLQTFLHDVIAREAASARNLAWVESKRHLQRQPAGASVTRDDIRREWRERDREILDAIGMADVSAPE